MYNSRLLTNFELSGTATITFVSDLVSLLRQPDKEKSDVTCTID